MQSFDDLTRALAQGISRREALRLLAASTLAAMVTPLWGDTVFAAPDTNVCKGVQGFFCGAASCPNIPVCGLGCACYPHLQNTNRTMCGHNNSCDSVIHCSTHADCGCIPGKHCNYFCLQTCCSGGMVCVLKCTIKKPCLPALQPGSGLTPSGRILQG